MPELFWQPDDAPNLEQWVSDNVKEAVFELFEGSKIEFGLATGLVSFWPAEDWLFCGASFPSSSIHDAVKRFIEDIEEDEEEEAQRLAAIVRSDLEAALTLLINRQSETTT